MDWLPIIWRAFGARAEIARLLQVLRPTIVEFRKVAPDVVVLSRSILGQIKPEAQILFDQEVKEKHDVYWLQKQLIALEGERLEVDGQYGEATKEAVKRYQQKWGLVVDGWAGVNTMAHIYARAYGK